MNINSIFNFIEKVMTVLSSWLSFEKKEMGWCPIKVDNRLMFFV